MDGFDSLLHKLDDLGSVGKKVGKEALQKGAKVVVEQQKKDAPKDTGDGAKHLEVAKVTTSLAQVGFTKDNWEQCKGIWYANWSFEHYISGKQITKNAGWIFNSLKNCEKEARSEIEKVLGDEIEKIL